ncbi:LysR family transcriptional regulator [Comamonas sp. NoAH]|uniref:LysR family transcriptional regulator n=1 Tax=Comamonas halotolerans TaxID=3041496 RepID=UPI0024E15898|nr:LysR family transcriptional regulator [Comamonas sp. NoAH]
MPFHFPVSMDFNDLYYFVQVVDHGGFAPAGRALNQPKSKLSRRIALLEARLGARLIQRSTRRFAVTEIGQAYYQRCVAMLVEAEAAQALIANTQTAPRGVVRLACPPALLDYHLGDALGRFMVQCPEVELHIESTNRRVDVILEGLDIAIRVRFPPLDDSELVFKVLGESHQCLLASPDLISRMGGLPTIADLGEWPSLGSVQGGKDFAWNLWGPENAQARILTKPRMVTDDRIALWRAALHGAGVVMLPTAMVQTDIDAGRLVQLLPQWHPRAGIVHAVFPSRRGLLPAVRALLDFLAQEFVTRPA